MFIPAFTINDVLLTCGLFCVAAGINIIIDAVKSKTELQAFDRGMQFQSRKCLAEKTKQAYLLSLNVKKEKERPTGAKGKEEESDEEDGDDDTGNTESCTTDRKQQPIVVE